MEILFVENLNDEPIFGRLEFYYNGYFQIRQDGTISIWSNEFILHVDNEV